MKYMTTILFWVVSMCMMAQTYDETQLVGVWEPKNVEGTLPHGILSLEQICLGDTVRDVSGYEPNGIPCSGLVNMYMKDNPNDIDEKYVLDFYITNNDKLHIIIGDDYSLRLKIEELTETSMKLKTYDGKCSITLEKSETTKVSEMKQEKSKSTFIYNRAGQRVSGQSINGLYIENGVKKLTVKQ